MTERKNRQHRRRKEAIDFVRTMKVYGDPLIEFKYSQTLSTKPLAKELESFYNRWEKIRGSEYVIGLRKIIETYLEGK